MKKSQCQGCAQPCSPCHRAPRMVAACAALAAADPLELRLALAQAHDDLLVLREKVRRQLHPLEPRPAG